MNKELISRLYSTEVEVRKETVYKILFSRLHELIPELKQAAFYEKDEEVAVLIAQTCMTLEAFPRDHSLERQILEYIGQGTGLNDLNTMMWNYLSCHGSSQMLIAAMGAMNETIPPKAHDFMESCLNHSDPEVRAVSCSIAINSGRPTHFAYVLNLITDSDPMVSEAAFRVVKELPSSQLNIILDFALGSPDEWVLQNVAPFLPLLITSDLRKAIAKVQYHQHPLVAKKAREALKNLDSIPFVSKRLREKHDAETAKKDELKSAGEGSDAEAQPDEDFASFKEEMEKKRQLKMEEDKLKREEDDKLSDEISQTSEDELENFADTLEEFEDEMIETSGADAEPEVDADKPLMEDLEFEDEVNVLDEVDDDVDFDNVLEKLEAAEAEQADELTSEKMDVGPGSDLEQVALEEPNTDFVVEEANLEDFSQDSDTEVLVPDFEEISNEIVNEVEVDSQIPSKEVIGVEDATRVEEIAVAEVSEIKEISVAKGDNAPAEVLESELEAEISQIEVEEITVDIVDDDDLEIEVVEEAAKKVSLPPEKTVIPKKPAEEKIPEGAIIIPQIPAAQTIISRFPSFLADPFSDLFKPARPEIHLNNIQLVVDNLTAYLNLCFLQSCMFFSPPSEVISKSVKDCLKGNLIGPTALRCLHNFALAMKQSRENPVFFTFSLANIISESSETNPIMMMRELKEYLKTPIDPIEETLPQAIEGLAEILRGVKSLLNNSIVMKAPKGAREPFADLSGPLASVLSADKRPGIELPEGEVVVISRDGTEALGLFPYFKYAKRKVVFNKPDEEDFAILLERLEISLD